MSHDLDSALRDSLRRHAESAPTALDTDGIRLRAKQIQRRRTLESVAAAFVLLGVVVGLGAVIGSLRTDATPPPVTSVTPAPNPGNLPPLAFSNGDGNNPDRLIVRVAGVETVVPNPAAGKGPLTFVGWYGPDHRTLVLASGASGFREGTLYSVTVGADGRIAGSPQPLTIPGLPSLGAGIVYAVRGGPLQFWVPLALGNPKSPSTLVTIAPDLASGTSRSMPTGLTAVTVTSDHALFVSPGTSALSVASLVGSGTLTTEPVTACARLTAAQTSLDGTRVALGCGDGTVDVLTLADRSVTRVAAVPEVTPDGGLLALWWDPSGGLHASTNPTGRADFTVVHSWDWTGTSWARGLDGLLTRAYPLDSPSARFMKENAAPGNNGRWIVESTPEVDLGPAGDTLALAPTAQATPSPSATPSSTNPPLPAALPWVATVTPYTGQATTTNPCCGNRLDVTVDGRTTTVYDASNAALEVIGWYGKDHRTLVIAAGQEQLTLKAITFASDGSVLKLDEQLSLPGVPDSNGYAFPLPAGGFVFTRFVSPTAYEAVWVDDGLNVTKRLTLATSGTPILATQDAVGVLVDATRIRVYSGATEHLWDLPDGCLTGSGSGPDAGTPPMPEPGGSWAALRCGGGTIAQIPLDPARPGVRVQTTNPLPGGVPVVGTWFDKDMGLWASSRSGPDATAATTFRPGIDYEEAWVKARVQNVLDRVDTGQGYGIGLYATAPAAGGPPNSWWTETTPMQLVGGQPGTVSSVGKSIAVRPKA
jgi:hypothetical protein